jgi:hypothetical protein
MSVLSRDQNHRPQIFLHFWFPDSTCGLNVWRGNPRARRDAVTQLEKWSLDCEELEMGVLL